MSREAHVRFWESAGVKFPRATHLPIERQCSRWQSYGIRIAPATLGRCVSAAIDLFAPLADAIADRTRAPGVLATDATGIPVLDADAPTGIRLGTIWCWTNARWVTFGYARKGDSASVRRFLGEENLDRTVQCDGTNITTFIERKAASAPAAGLMVAAALRKRRASATRLLWKDSASSRRSSRWSDSRRSLATPPNSVAHGETSIHVRSLTNFAFG